MIQLTLLIPGFATERFARVSIEEAVSAAAEHLLVHATRQHGAAVDREALTSQIASVAPGDWTFVSLGDKFAAEIAFFQHLPGWRFVYSDTDVSCDWNNHNSADYSVCEGFGVKADDALSDAIARAHPGLRLYCEHDSLIEYSGTSLELKAIPWVEERVFLSRSSL